MPRCNDNCMKVAFNFFLFSEVPQLKITWNEVMKSRIYTINSSSSRVTHKSHCNEETLISRIPLYDRLLAMARFSCMCSNFVLECRLHLTRRHDQETMGS